MRPFTGYDNRLPDKGRCLLLTSRLSEHCRLFHFQPLALAPLTLEDDVQYLLLIIQTAKKRPPKH